MANGIVLTNAIRQNLLSLQNTGELQAKVQERLATGKKVNSALDGPTNFFTAAGLNRRASDLSTLLDGMMNGIKTLEAADKGMKGITQTVETMRAYVRQARQDKSFKGISYTHDTSTNFNTAAVTNLTFSGGAVGTTPISIPLNTASPADTTVVGGGAVAGAYAAGNLTIQAPGLNGGAAVTIAIGANTTAPNVVIAINTALDALAGGDSGITASEAAGIITLTNISGRDITVGGDAALLTGLNLTAGTSTNGTEGVVQTVDQLVATINAHASLAGKVKASNDGGKLHIDNISTEALSVVGASATAVTGGTGGSNTQSIGGNEVRKSLIAQFNELRQQLDRLAEDAGYNGVNLLKADKLKIAFNEVSTSILEIEAKDSNGVVRPINTGATSLDIVTATAAEFADDVLLEARVEKLGDALIKLHTQSSAFGSSLSIVQVRQEFTKGMINTLEVGADNLTLADSNEEGANLLALNTRQQLAQTTLSLAAQAQQAVLRLFG